MTLGSLADIRPERFEDHEVYTPPNRLGKALRLADEGPAIDLDAITRAEAALAALSVEFADWMHNEVRVLDAARDLFERQGETAETVAALFRAAHDIKGEAATFGFPFAARIAAGLCTIIERCDGDNLPKALISAHVDAIRAIVRQNAKGHDNTTAELLAQRLEDMADKAIPGRAKGL